MKFDIIREMKKEIGYPNGKKAKPNAALIRQPKQSNKSNLGQSLESDLNQTNEFYRIHQIALVHKKPTPVTVVEVDYPKRSAAMITKAFYQLPSTTDYNGIYRGIPIDFEAKQTQNVKRIPLSMIHPHQLQHLKNVLLHHGLSFLIIRFVKLEETYLVPYERLDCYLNESEQRSIAYDWIKDNGFVIKSSYTKPCDYITALQEYINLGEYTYE